jgi:hypothetical protein
VALNKNDRFYGRDFTSYISSAPRGPSPSAVRERDLVRSLDRFYDTMPADVDFSHALVLEATPPVLQRAIAEHARERARASGVARGSSRETTARQSENLRSAVERWAR